MTRGVVRGDLAFFPVPHDVSRGFCWVEPQRGRPPSIEAALSDGSPVGDVGTGKPGTHSP